MSNSTRSSNPSTSSYDERYVVPLEASRRGAHRARVSPVVSVLPVVAVVGIVLGAISLVYVFLGHLGGGSGAATQVAASASTTSPPASPSATSPAVADPSPSGAAAADGAADKTIALAVYNGSGATGVARKVADKLTADGWTVGTTATWPAGVLAETTVYYGVDSQRPSALALVKLLGHGVAKLSAAKSGNGLAVVIGKDYTGSVPSATRVRASTTKAAATNSTKAAATPTASGTATKNPAATTSKSATSATGSPPA